MRYMLIHCVDESAWSDPATPRPRARPGCPRTPTGSARWKAAVCCGTATG
jgi:hypothetical protein